MVVLAVLQDPPLTESQESPPTALSGSSFDFRVVKLLGQGACARVFLAMDLRNKSVSVGRESQTDAFVVRLLF
jgi:hypothetical protein